jgi:hypothetical protein
MDRSPPIIGIVSAMSVHSTEHGITSGTGV